jgi:hypothetical protein
VETELIIGNRYDDARGQLFYNNDFDATIKRIYIIREECYQFCSRLVTSNWTKDGSRVVKGKFKIELIQIDNWEQPPRIWKCIFIIDSNKLDVIHVPKGYVSSIQSLYE